MGTHKKRGEFGGTWRSPKGWGEGPAVVVYPQGEGSGVGVGVLSRGPWAEELPAGRLWSLMANEADEGSRPGPGTLTTSSIGSRALFLYALRMVSTARW